MLLFCGGSIAFDDCISQGGVWKSADELKGGSAFLFGIRVGFFGSEFSMIHFKEPFLIGTQKVRRRT